jgi:tol-pal system protein YbgF
LSGLKRETFAIMSLRLAVSLAACLVGFTPAVAQDPQPLRIERAAPAPAPLQQPGAAAPAGQAVDGRAMAVMQNRIAALEEEVRRLTGRLEDAEFQDQRTRQRIDDLVADLDRRLMALDQAAMAQTAPEGQAAPPPADDAGSVGPALVAPGAAGGDAAAADVEPDPAAREGHVLGTIPRDAVLGLPQPDGSGPSGTAPRATLEGTAAARFTASLDLLQTGDWSAAEVAFDRWLADFPDDPQAPVAAYWLGESQLAREDFATAAATFAGNYRTYGDQAPRAPDNLLKLGTALAAMGDQSRACQTFIEMERRYPNASPALLQARERESRAAGCG